MSAMKQTAGATFRRGRGRRRGGRSFLAGPFVPRVLPGRLPPVLAEQWGQKAQLLHGRRWGPGLDGTGRDGCKGKARSCKTWTERVPAPSNSDLDGPQTVRVGRG